MTTITLTGDYGYSAYYGSNLPSGTLIDATQASWHLNQSIDPYPFRVYDSVAPILRGGTIWGEASQTADWQDIYINSAAVLIKHSPDAVIDNWYVDKPWDAFRINDASTNFLIDDVHVTNARDDAVEDDDMLGGTIRDSLFDGVFSGISLAATSYIDGSSNTVTLDHVFMRMEKYLYKGVFEGASPIKADTANPQNVPHLRFIDTVIAIEDPNHMGQNRLQIAWDHTVDVQGSVYLNLSDTPFGPDYPMPPAGFTVLQGQAARDYWALVKAAWLDNHDGTPIADITPLPPLPGASPTVPVSQPSPVNIINGTSLSETLVGTTGADQINGFEGSDLIYGKGGNDILTGGSGGDKFVFDTLLGSGNVDTITDFDTRYDYIYLDNAIFTKLGDGSLSSPHRLSSHWFDDRADDGNDYVLYDKATGILSYDADGNGAGAAVEIAHLTPGTSVSYADIFIV